ncbi:PAS domain S-box protein, partial [Candidatus Cloacimonadota bacterium]
SLNNKMNFITDEVVDILDADFARIWLTDKGDLCEAGCLHAEVKEGPHVCKYRDKCLHLVASSGRYTHINSKAHGRVPYGCYKIGRVAASQDVGFLTNDVIHDRRVHNHEWAEELGLVSFAGYRLLSHSSDPIGVLALFSKHKLSDSEEALLHTIADTTSKIIQETKFQEDLEKNEEKFRTLTENLNVGVYRNTPGKKGTFIEVNPAFQRIFGYKNKDDIMKMNVSDLYINPEDRIGINEEMKQNGILSNKEVQLKRKDGTPIFCSFSAVAIRADNEIQYYDGIIEDVTERKQAQQALKDSKERYHLLFNLLPYGAEVIDIKGNIINCSVSTAKMLGYELSELVGMNIAKLLSSDSLNIFKEKFPKLLQGNKVSTEIKMIRKDGQELNILRAAQPILNEDGKVETILALNLDITQRKRAEDQIEKELREKNTLLRELYHRTKNNMQVISSMLRMQSRQSDNEYIRNTFEEVNNRIKSMALVHQKLYQSKDLSQINLKEYIQDMVKLLKHSYGKISEKIAFNLELDDVFVLIDSGIPLGLILNELISNSFKHAFPNDLNGEISIQLFQDENELINIIVGDNGVGVSEDFDPGNASTMGLQTVHNLIGYQLKGQIRYDTENGLKWQIRLNDKLNSKRV